jgi:signal transduction histidine kinase/DNA-binding response OmpR family regulator
MRGQVNILLVDDQPAGLAALQATLARLGQNLFSAGSGRDALRLLLQHDFAVILLDVVMPEMDGFETAKLIRRRERSARTPIIFLTGLKEGEVPLFEAYALGAVDYLVKPFEPDILRSKVSVFVDLARQAELIRSTAEALRDAQRREHERELLETTRKFEAERLEAQREVLKQQMEAGLNQQRWLEAILDGMPTPLVLLDPTSPRTVFANDAARQLAGGVLARPGPLPEGFTVADVSGGAMSEEQMPAYRAARGEKLSAFQLHLQGPGLTKAILAHSERLDPMFGHPETVLLTLLDVTELKQVEEELQAALRVQEDFLAVASHELRTPLTALQFQVRNAMRSWERPEAATAPAQHALKYLGQIEMSIVRLTQLSAYLLDVSRISHGALDLELSPVNLSALVREVLQRLEGELARAQCEARMLADGDIVGLWDRTRLDQVLTNLLSNAIKYAPGKPIEVELKSSGETAAIVVRDHGEGIPRERQGALFERFSRAPERGQAAGFGLGLWIVDQIISRHGGRVAVHSRPGEGTAFTLWLPRGETPRA